MKNMYGIRFYNMKVIMQTILFFLGILSVYTNCSSPVSNEHYPGTMLTLERKIELRGVSGRIDHIAYDPEDKLAFIAALGNNTVEVVNIVTGKIVHTISNLDEPQGVAYIPFLKRLVVANGGNGGCIFYDLTTYNRLKTFDFKRDADNIRFDSASGRVYAGYGNGGIAVIDANSMNQVGTITLDGHPESFQVSDKKNCIYINIPDKNEIAVASLSNNSIIAKWKNTKASSNFPMALDDKNNLFIGYRHPAMLQMISTETGQVAYAVASSGDADDVFCSVSDSTVFVSAGQGFIDVFKTNLQNELHRVDRITTSKGARTSLLLDRERKFLLAVPAHGEEAAALWIYTIN